MKLFLALWVLSLTVYGDERYCESYLFADQPGCGDGSFPLESGCCQDTGECPPSCKTAKVKEDKTCKCDKCRNKFLPDLTTSERWLRAHNYHRCRHGAPLLQWNEALAAQAQGYADTCQRGHSAFKDRAIKAGENMAYGFGTDVYPERATNAWYDEIKFYKPGVASASITGHYTALIWKATTLLGCGSCLSDKTYVCQYADKTPNLKGGYENNVPQTATFAKTEDQCCQEMYGPVCECTGKCTKKRTGQRKGEKRCEVKEDSGCADVESTGKKEKKKFWSYAACLDPSTETVAFGLGKDQVAVGRNIFALIGVFAFGYTLIQWQFKSRGHYVNLSLEQEC